MIFFFFFFFLLACNAFFVCYVCVMPVIRTPDCGRWQQRDAHAVRDGYGMPLWEGS